MKTTVSISIASQAFVIDTDAYLILDRYLRSIKARLDDGDTETMADIEARVAEILCDNLPSPMMVVTAAMARKVISQIGEPEIFGDEAKNDNADAEREQFGMHEPRQPKLQRSRSDRILAGVCGGLAEYMDIDASLLRLATLLLVLFGGLSAWVYIILWIVIPEQRRNYNINA